MKLLSTECRDCYASRSPCGERGLKFSCIDFSRYSLLSLPVRGAWIEMLGVIRSLFMVRSSLPVRGAWIEITLERYWKTYNHCRSPCGERGLKFDAVRIDGDAGGSLPVRGAWIEMYLVGAIGIITASSLPVRGAWIEIRRNLRGDYRQAESLPVRGAWIEIMF